MIETLQKINKSYSISINRTSNNKTTSTENPFSVSSYL